MKNLRRNKKGSAVAVAVIAVVVIFALILLGLYVAGVIPSASSSKPAPQPTPAPGASVITTIPSGDYTGNLSVNTATHVISGAINWDSVSSDFVLGAHHGAPTTFGISVQMSRSDGLNSSAGFNVGISNIPTAANTSSGTFYSPIAYTAATSSAPGIWSIVYTNGSLNGQKPSVAAPSTVTTNPDLLGVAAYGSGIVKMTFALGGSGFYNLQPAQYSSYSFTITVSGAGSGMTATPSSWTVTLTVASAPPTGSL
jgi:hypothetical protein